MDTNQCRGACFRQADDGEYYEKDRDPICKQECKLVECHTCRDAFPQLVLDCHKGHCMKCASVSYAWQKLREIKDGQPDGICQHCYKKLVPIGHDRYHGAPHDDWATRKFHKKCWAYLKK